MRKIIKGALFFIVGLAFSGVISGYAQAQSIDELSNQINDMSNQITAQQEQISKLNAKLEQQSGNQGFVREDLDSIVGNKVEDYMKSHAQNPHTFHSGYNKGFYIRTDDNKYSLRTNGMLQFWYSYDDNDSDEDSSGFKVHRGRLKFSGHAIDPRLKYMLQLETRSTGTKDGSKAVEMLDFIGDFSYMPHLKFKFGQWKVPFNTQKMTSAGKLQMVDRSEADDEFSLNRQLGVMVYGDFFEEKLEYYFGVWNGNFRNEKHNDNNEHLWIFRTAYSPLGNFGGSESDLEYSESPLALIAAAVAVDSEDVSLNLREIGEVETDETDKTQFVGEIGFKYKGFFFLSEYYWRKRSGLESSNLFDHGFFAQAGYFLIPKKLEIAGRYSMIDFDDELEESAVRETSFGLNYYFVGHKSKLQFNAIRFDEEEDVDDEIDYTYRLQYQMAF